LKKNLLFFKYSKFTKYSIAALIGSIETNKFLQDLEIKIGVLDDFFKINTNNFNKIFIAISILSTQLGKIKDEVIKIRERFHDNIIIIGGGPHATAKPRLTIKLGFDYLVIGEGEQIFPTLLEYCIKENEIDTLNGICFKKNGVIIYNKPIDFIDLNKYPPFSVKYRVFSPIEISRGCEAGNCAYCMVPRMYGKKMRHRGVDIIKNTINLALKKGYNKVWFTSPNSFAYGSNDGKTPNVPKIINLLKTIKKCDEQLDIYFGTFPGEVRPDSVNEDIINAVLPYISNKSCIIGGQSGSNRVLQILQRNHKVEDIENAVDILLKYNIIPKVDMIFGFYFEKPEDEEKNIQFMKRIIKKGAIIHGHTFMPLPGTALEKAPPGKLSTRLRYFLGKWSKKGNAYGSWEFQEKLAVKLSKLEKD